MRKLQLLVIVFLSATLLMGMGAMKDINYESKIVLSDPKDRVFPLKSGTYLGLKEFGGLLSEDLKKHLSPTEQALYLTKTYIPELPKKDTEAVQLNRQKDCYSAIEGKTQRSFVFENITGNFFLMESYDGSCKQKGQKANTDYIVTYIKNNHLYMIFDLTYAEFVDWAISQNAFKRLRYGIEVEEKIVEKGKKTKGKTEQVKELKKYVVLSNTKSIKAYYQKNISRLEESITHPIEKKSIDKMTTISMPFWVLNSEVVAYKDQMDLDAKITRIEKRIALEKEKKREEERKRKEKEQQRIAAEKNDGVIRYAFGQKIGEVRNSEYDTIAYFTLGANLEKSSFFQDYYALTTPETHQTFSIYGVSECMRAQRCKQKAEEVMSMLSAKYGKPLPHVPVESASFTGNRKDTDDAFLYFRRIEQKKHNRLIELVCVTDANQIKQKQATFKHQGCWLDVNLFDEEIAKVPLKRLLFISENHIYNQRHGQNGYSDYENDIIPFIVPQKQGFNWLYPAPMPHLSRSYNKYYRNCGLNEKNDIFRLFIRYSDTELENLIISERDNIKIKKEETHRKETIDSPKAKGW